MSGRRQPESKKLSERIGLKDGAQDWQKKCSVCDQLPTVHPTGLCGPCCFGEAETVGGNW